MRMVLKFGGTSLSDMDKIRSAAAMAAELVRQGWQVVVVVSAQGHTTDRLLTQAAQASDAVPPREMDALLAAGEQMSAALMAMALKRWAAVPSALPAGRQVCVRRNAMGMPGSWVCAMTGSPGSCAPAGPW